MSVGSDTSQRFEALAQREKAGDLLKVKICEQGRVLSYAAVLDFWEDDQNFVDFYLSLLKHCGFSSYVWETPALSEASADREFEFVIQSARFFAVQPDQATFAAFFDSESAPEGIVSFLNLGGDALLVVPSPHSDRDDYSNLAAFCREAPIAQQRALWREVAVQAKARLSNRPFWLSVAGGGVNWLHVRLDSSPKYYRYGSYRAAP